MATTNDLSSELSDFTSPSSPLSDVGDDPSSLPTHQPRIHKKASRKRRGRRQSMLQKVQIVQQIIRDERVTLYDVVQTFYGLSKVGGSSGSKQWKSFVQKLHEPDDPLLQSLLHGQGTGEFTAKSPRKYQLASLERLDWGKDFLRKEVLNLGDNLELFNYWEPSNPQSFLRSSNSDQLAAIQKLAPNFYEILVNILHPFRAQKDGVKYSKEMICIVPLCAILCYSQQKHKASAFQKGLAMYLHSNGTKQAVMEVLHKFNLCIGRDTTQNLLKEGKERGKNAIREIGRRPTAIIHYDNLEQLQRVRDQRVDSNDKHMSVTTGYVIQGVCIKDEGLKSAMMDYNQPLALHDIAESEWF